MGVNIRLILKIGILGIILAGILYHLHPSELSKTFAQSKPPQSAWEVDLTKFGYQGRPPIYLGPADIEGLWTWEQGVLFTESNVVAAFFIVRDDPSGAASQQRKFSSSDRFRLVAAFFNAENGEFLKKFERPLAPGENGAQMFPATNGRFILGIGNKLSLYSPDFKILAEYTSKSGIEDIVSPSGETVLLGNMQLVAGQWSEQFDLIETEGLTVLKSWESYPQPNQMLWGDEIATRTLQSISIRTPDTEPRRVVEGRDWFCGDGSFINKETMALFQCGPVEKLFMVSTNGTILHQFDLGLEKADGPVVASRNGTRFALPTQHWGSGRNKDPEKLLARVFGLDADEPILTVGVTPHYSSSPNVNSGAGDTRFGWGGMALSPNGDLLAVKSGPIVQLYRVPKAGVSTACSGDCGSDKASANPRFPSLQQPPDVPAPAVIAAPSELVRETLSWLPDDTETVTASNGPFPVLDVYAENNDKPHSNDLEETIKTFRPIPMGLFGFHKRLMGRFFKDQTVLLALEGARNFRVPSGLGVGPFQGCDIAVFAEDATANVDSFRRNSSNDILRTEQIEGQQVSVFQEKLEEDIWTIFVAFPRPNIAIAATDEKYLREVLARINGKRGERALPESLPEWKYVDRRAAFWAVRHYDRTGASTDPSSPFVKNCSWLMPDNQAIGLTFNFDPDKSKTATVTYLSADKNILPVVQKNLFQVEHEQGAREMHIRYREIAPGVVEGSYDLDHIESAETFTFFLVAFLGHVIFL